MARGLQLWGRFVVQNEQGESIKITIPAPSTDPGKPYLADFVHANARDIASNFDVAQWPPLTKAQGGNGVGCDGYGVFDRRDLGSKNQQGSLETRYGNCESYMAAIAALLAGGCISSADVVLHQLIGENGGPGVFEYLGPDGRTLNGRGKTAPSWFRGGMKENDPIPPFRPEDEVPVPSADVPFGREVLMQHALPENVTIEDAIDSTQKMIHRLDMRMMRVDDTKGMWAEGVRRILEALGIPSYSEYYDGSPQNLDWWATSAPMFGISAVEDFTWHYHLQAACNGFDATQLLGQCGFWQIRPGLSLDFPENPDTDTNPGNQIVFNKGLGEALTATVPCMLSMVYGKDYFGGDVWPGSYGLKPIIDKINWASRMFAFGAASIVWTDRDVFAITRDGDGGPVGWSGGLLTAVNFNVLSARTVRCATPFGPSCWIHDYLGNGDDTHTDEYGWATITIPSNAYSSGRFAVMYSKGGVHQAIEKPALRAKQCFFGEDDLDLGPVRDGTQKLPQRLYCASGHPLQLDLKVSRRGSSMVPSHVQIWIANELGTMLSMATTGNGSTASLTFTPVQTDWYTIVLVGVTLPAEGFEYRLTAEYMGSQKL